MLTCDQALIKGCWYTGVQHEPGRHAKDWDKQPADYYPTDAQITSYMDKGVADLVQLMRRELRDTPQGKAFIMWDSVGITAAPATDAGPPIAYSVLAELPLLSALQVSLAHERTRLIRLMSIVSSAWSAWRSQFMLSSRAHPHPTSECKLSFPAYQWCACAQPAHDLLQQAPCHDTLFVSACFYFRLHVHVKDLTRS